MILSTPFEDYPQNIQDIILHGTKGEKVDVHYVGQRGRGVYSIEFEGLIKNVERRYRETASDTTKAGIRDVYADYPMFGVWGKKIEKGISGCYSGRSEYCGNL